MKKKEEKVIREPIMLSPHAIAVLHIFTRTDCYFEDTWIYDIDRWVTETYQNYEKAAKQFIAQLEGHECLYFMRTLRKELDEYITREERSNFPESPDS